jgi:Ca-activated chloride channel family protein
MFDASLSGFFSQEISQFHFIRPQWLWCLLLVPIISILMWRVKKSANQWQSLISKELLAHLIVGENKATKAWPIIILGVAMSLAIIAIAGPSWLRLAQPQYVNQQPVVMLVDLSPSMLVEDVKPSRLAKMRFKMIDFLKARKQGLTAMVVYAGDAHVLAPLSDDNKTLISLVPTLSPNVMPVSGSLVEEGVALAISLIEDQGYKTGDIVLFSDGVSASAEHNTRKLLEKSNIRLSVIGVGTFAGAPIPLGEQGFAKDKNGKIVLARLNPQPLMNLAVINQGVYSDLLLSNDDIDKVLNTVSASADQYKQLLEEYKEHNSNMDQWQDFGQWLVLLLLPLALLGFRRGWLLQVALIGVFVMPILKPTQAMALGWEDLWQSGDQQGAKAFAKKDYAQAAEQFSDSAWQGAAQFENGDYAAAAQSFAALNSADGYYNQGNALARQGDLEKALTAYDKALLLSPDLADAKTNKALVQALLDRKKQQEKQQKQESKENQDSKESKESKENQQEQDSKDKSDQKNSDKQKSDQQQKGDNQSEQDSGAGEQEKESDQQQGDDQKQSTEKSELDQLKKQQQEKEQQALEQKALEEKPVEEDSEADSSDEENAAQVKAMAEQLDEKQQAEQQQLENWLGQLPEDASRLVRNKFNYEYQKKRQAYRNGQWQPSKEQRW